MCRMLPLLACGLAFAGEIQAQDATKEALWTAARKGDAAAVEDLLRKGVTVDAQSAYGATALHFAAEKGHLEVVRVLLVHKADPNRADTFYKLAPAVWGDSHPAVVAALLEAGASADPLLVSAVATGKVERVRLLLEKGKCSDQTLGRALAAAKDRAELKELLEKAGAKLPPLPGEEVPAEVIAAVVGHYRGENGEVELKAEGVKLMLAVSGRTVTEWRSTGADAFVSVENPTTTIQLQRDGDQVAGFLQKRPTQQLTYARFVPKPAASPPTAAEAKEDPPGPIAPANWPSFRGPGASGIADGQHPPISWNVEQGTRVRWKTPILGLAHSCPVIWDDRIYLTTAVRTEGEQTLKVGLYGDVDSAADATEHEWRVLCLDKQSGKILWEQTAHRGVPKGKRHTKATHANCTPATDGRHVVACFGSEGLYCFDMDGKRLWKAELGMLDSGWFFNPEYQWGFASSPIIYKGLVIVQCDVGQGSFIAAFRLSEGSEAWRTPREEIPSWGTPTIVAGPTRDELVTSATKFVRSYNPLTGAELWRLSGQSEITTPTPIFAGGLIYVASGYRPTKPIFAVKPGAEGDISLAPGESSSAAVAWSVPNHGPYMSTPLVYRGLLYACAHGGLLTCLDAATGQVVYGPLRQKGTYSASPVAADGRLYLTSEEGHVRVIQAGKEFVLLAENELGEPCLATPAIADGAIFFRTEHHLLSLGVPR